MAISGKPSSENSGGREFYYGKGSFKVLAVNPTKDEWKALTGIELKSEPEYTGIKGFDGREWNKVSFLVECIEPSLADEDDKFITRVEFLINGDPSVSREGKAEVINQYGKHTYVKDLEDLKDERFNWFLENDAEVRQAFSGESNLIEFLKVWCNVPSGGEVALENPEALFEKFDIKELKSIVRAYKDENFVDLLIGIVLGGDGKLYHKVYNKYYGRYQSDPLYFVRKLQSNSRNAFNAIYPEDMKFQKADSAEVGARLAKGSTTSSPASESSLSGTKRVGLFTQKK